MFGHDDRLEFPSASSLYIEICAKGQKVSSATGFLVESPAGSMLITCRHVVTGRDNVTGRIWKSWIPDELRVYHHLPPTDDVFKWTSHSERLFDAEGNQRWYEHPHLGKDMDVVALPISAPRLVVQALLPIDDRPPSEILSCKPGDLVSVVGFPFGLSAGGRFPIWLSGYLASEPSVDAWENAPGQPKPVLLIDCRTREGMSGAPVIMVRHGSARFADGSTGYMVGGPALRFLGVYSGRIQAESDVGIVWKAKAVRELVASIPKAGDRA